VQNNVLGTVARNVTFPFSLNAMCQICTRIWGRSPFVTCAR
jgi:hypothetical protein